MPTPRLALTLLSLAATALIAACGGGDDPATDPPTDGGGGSSFTATCDTTAYTAGSVELPTAAQIAAYAGTFNGDEGSYNMSGVFTKSGDAALVIASDGVLTYKDVEYEPLSICIEKVSGAYGKIMYFIANDKGHFDVSDEEDADLGQAWGVSPVDGTTVFTKGVK
ncbi:MAG: hypothetical protein IV094_09465 [Vitreoscilla sp.]|nr:hypothetical protein [Vitreoscilla sp.]